MRWMRLQKRLYNFYSFFFIKLKNKILCGKPCITIYIYKYKEYSQRKTKRFGYKQQQLKYPSYKIYSIMNGYNRYTGYTRLQDEDLDTRSISKYISQVKV